MVKSLRKIRIDRPKKETEPVGAEQLNVAVTPAAALSSSGTEGAPHASLKSPTALLLKTGNHPLQQTPQLHPNISPPPNRLAAPSRQHQHRVAAYARRLSNQAALAPSVLSKSDAEFVVFAVRGAAVAVATPSPLQDSATPHSSLKTVIRLPKTSSTIQVRRKKMIFAILQWFGQMTLWCFFLFLS